MLLETGFAARSLTCNFALCSQLCILKFTLITIAALVPHEMHIYVASPHQKMWNKQLLCPIQIICSQLILQWNGAYS
jgi:hypothetical protein